MKKKSVKWIRDENGAVIVLVALALTVLLGMSALAVDYGSLVVAKSELQNAADAAALAGARALIDGDSMPAAVVAMCADNNCDTADGATVTSAQGTHNGKRTVTVTVTKRSTCPSPRFSREEHRQRDRNGDGTGIEYFRRIQIRDVCNGLYC
jgi:Flp pilus assembly protein TadG